MSDDERPSSREGKGSAFVDASTASIRPPDPNSNAPVLQSKLVREGAKHIDPVMAKIAQRAKMDGELYDAKEGLSEGEVEEIRARRIEEMKRAEEATAVVAGEYRELSEAEFAHGLREQHISGEVSSFLWLSSGT